MRCYRRAPDSPQSGHCRGDTPLAQVSTPESSSFINAILDAIYKSSQGEQANVKQMSASVEALIKSEELANKAALEEKKREPKNEES